MRFLKNRQLDSTLIMRFSLMFQCVTSAVLACVICNFTPCNSVKLFQTSEQEDGELSVSRMKAMLQLPLHFPGHYLLRKEKGKTM